jgi:uncharacterized phage protein gp47/JayE
MITIPTINQLYTGIISDINTEYGVNINPFGKAVLRCFAAVHAAKLKIYYLVIAALQKNVAPDTCDEETLIRFGTIKLGRVPFAAVAAQYTVKVTGTIGAVIPAQSTFKSDDSSLNPGVLYVLDSAYTLVSATDYITVRCLTLGTDGKLDLLDTLTPTAPIPLVNSEPSSVSVFTVSVQPLAAEEIEAYRTAVILSYRLEAQGGAATDYRLWAQDAQGVERVYPYAKSGFQGEINLYVEATIVDSIDGKGTPTTQILTDVESVVEFNPDTSLALNERGRRPLQAMVNYLPVTIKTIVITITGYSGITTAIQATLLTALTDTINAMRPFVAGADVLTDKNDIIDTNKLIGSIITAKPGAVFTSVTFTVDAISMSTYTFNNGNIPYLNPTIIYN